MFLFHINVSLSPPPFPPPLSKINKHPRVSINTNSGCRNSRGLKSDTDLTGLSSALGRADFLLETLGENLFLGLLKLLEPHAMAWGSLQQWHHCDLCLCCHICPSNADPPAFLLEGPWDCSGPTWRVQDNLPAPWSLLTPAKFLLPYARHHPLLPSVSPVSSSGSGAQ